MRKKKRLNGLMLKFGPLTARETVDCFLGWRTLKKHIWELEEMQNLVLL